MKTILVGVGVLVVAGLLIVMPLISSRNDLVTEKNDIDGKWAQVDNDMKRRADMIPNLGILKLINLNMYNQNHREE